MENPSSWLPGSDIYYDDPDITDDISLDFNGKNAIVVSLFQELLSLQWQKMTTTLILTAEEGMQCLSFLKRQG